MIILDGSDAGGQYLRSALSLSVVTGQAFTLTNIRGKREKPGLQPQHLTCVEAMKHVCTADVEGGVLHSTTLQFTPKSIHGGTYYFDIGTAGSTTLVLQTLLPALLFADQPSEITITGGTANPLAPSAFDLEQIFFWHLQKMGIKINFELLQEGFAPKGGGKIRFKVSPVKRIQPIHLLERGKFLETNVFSFCSEDLQKRDVGKRLLDGFKQDFPRDRILQEYSNVVHSLCTGCYLHAFAQYEQTRLGWTVLGEQRKPAEMIGKECARHLLQIMNSTATIDPFTTDQLVLYLALAKQGSFVIAEITEHLKTNIALIEKFLPVKFTIEKNVLSCTRL